jgi:hypothetical protein
MNPSVGVSSPLITNLLFATVTVSVVGELALFAVSSAEKLVGILILFSIRFLRDSRLLNRAPILEFVTPLYLFKVRGSCVVKSRSSVGSVTVVSVASSVTLGASVVVSSGTAVDPGIKPSSSIVVSSLVVVGCVVTPIAFVKKACVAVVNTETYEPVFFMITFDDDVVA